MTVSSSSRVSVRIRPEKVVAMVWILFGFVFNLLAVSEASLPSKITYFVTVRSFMAASCRNSSEPSVLEHQCPDDPTIIDQVKRGIISGHPDFERRIPPKLYYEVDSATSAYNNSFAQFGRPFPLTATRDIGKLVRPFVLSSLEYDTTGIGAMRYCRGEEGYPCDFDGIPDGTSVMNETSFSTWYRDSKKYNKRVGYKQDLYAEGNGTAKYQFDAGNPAQNPLGNSLYDPLTQHGLLSKAWPLSKLERVQTPNISCSKGPGHCPDGKFWFTSEVHSNFQYLGGEQFRFAGDDDVHIFINGRLAINLGGVHSVVNATIDLDTYAEELNLTKGEVYSFDLFHAERQTKGSNYAISTTLAQMCNVITSDFRSNGSEVNLGINWVTNTSEIQTPDDSWFILGGPGFGYVSSPNFVTLMSPSVPNVAAYMFHKVPQNIGSGFSLSFQFRMTGTSGHGFALLLHGRSEGLRNFNGGTGPNLGLRNLENSFAVVFDMCPNYPQCDGLQQQIRLHYPNDTSASSGLRQMNENSLRTRRVYDAQVMQNWIDGELHTVQVFYYSVPDWLEVYVDDSLRLVQRGFSIEQVVHNRNAYIGFASTSSLEGSALNVEIGQVAVKTVKVSSGLSTLLTSNESFPIQFVADGEEPVGITLQTRDACGNKLQYGGLASLAQGRAVRKLQQRRARNMRQLQQSEDDDQVTINGTTYKYYPGKVVDNLDGTYTLQFTTRDEGDYSLYAAFGDNCTWNSTTQQYESSLGDGSSSSCWTFAVPDGAVATPYVTFAPTESRDPQSLDLPWNIIYGVGIGFGGLILCIFCMMVVMLRYRRKWRHEKRFVPTGQQAILDHELELTGNPLGQKLQEMANKLQGSKQEVLKLRAVSGTFSDEKMTLSAETKRLKDEVKMLKRRHQEEEVLDVSKSDRVLARPSSTRIGFKPEMVKSEALTAMDVLESLPSPPPVMNIPPVYVERHDARATFLVSISRRDVNFIMEIANDQQQTVTGGNVFGQFYENGDALVMHCIGPGSNSIRTQESFVQSQSFMKEATDYLGKSCSAFPMGIWLSTSANSVPVTDLLEQAETYLKSSMTTAAMANKPVMNKYFLCLLVQLCGVKHERMVVTITPYRYIDGRLVHKQHVGDLYVFEDDTDSDALRRHQALEVMRSRPPPPTISGNTPPVPPSRPAFLSGNSNNPPPPPPSRRMPSEPPSKRRQDAGISPVAQPPPPGLMASYPPSESGMLVVTPRRMSLGGDDEQSLVPAILDGDSSSREPPSKNRFTGFFSGGGTKQ